MDNQGVGRGEAGDEGTQDGGSRRRFLRQAATAASAATGALAAASLDAEAQAPGRRRTPAYRLDAATASLLTEIRKDENDHVAFLVNALGSQARPKPTFQNLLQPTPFDFVRVATVLENVGVGAYLFALPALAGSDYLLDAGKIALIEARHAGALNHILNLPVTANQAPGSNAPSFETPLIPPGVVQLAMPFIANLNGGPPILPLNSVVDIINFALVLEYLESEFYNLNVARFIG